MDGADTVVTDTPSILENWGGIILGFYFGTFVGLLKEWLVGPGKEKGETVDADPSKREEKQSSIDATSIGETVSDAKLTKIESNSGKPLRPKQSD